MKKTLFIIISFISIFIFSDKVKASEATCVYGDNFKITIKDNKISAAYIGPGAGMGGGSITVTNNLVIGNFTDSNNKLVCLNEVSYNVTSGGRSVTYSLVTSGGKLKSALNKDKSSVKNDEPSNNTPAEKVLLKCSYKNNFIIKTDKEIKVQLAASDYTLSTNYIKYDDIGSTCPSKIYLLCTSRGGNFCAVSLNTLPQASSINLDGTLPDADNINNPDADKDNEQTDKDKDKIETGTGFFGGLGVIKCGNSEMPEVIPSITRTIVTLIKIATPLVLIIMGMLDMIRSVTAGDEKKIAEARGKFIKRLMAGALVFFVITILQFLIGVVAPEDKENLLKCVDCMVNDAGKCGAVSVGSSGQGNSSNSNNNSNSSNNSNGNNQEEAEPKQIIYVGDSRTVGMCSSVSLDKKENCNISKNSQGYNWFENTALPQIKQSINTSDKYYIVINMGTNDLGNSNFASKYAKLYNDLANAYPKSKVFVTSVTPIDDSKAKSNGYSVTNSLVNSFNKVLKNNINGKVHYCDVYSKINKNYNTIDGLHYTNDNYKKIYQEINACF